MNDKAIFHVHTFRCGHAGNWQDREYIDQAVRLGAAEIWFTDHAPFPGNPFLSRMQHEELSSYIADLSQLRNEYEDRIAVMIGLEIEYLPSFKAWYETLAKLRQRKILDILLLGQHFYEADGGRPSFALPIGKSENEMFGAADAIVEGMKTGIFDAVAHPDRIFRRSKSWQPKMEQLSRKIIQAAVELKIPLEQNYNSMRHKHYYWPEFWRLVPAGTAIIRGCDAHTPTALRF